MASGGGVFIREKTAGSVASFARLNIARCILTVQMSPICISEAAAVIAAAACLTAFWS